MKRLADQTLYEILEVRTDADASEVEAALERTLAQYGPGSLAMYTLMAPDESELLARRLEEARATLLDPEARARYDARLGRTGEARADGGAAADGLATLPPVIAAVQPAEPPRPIAPEPPAPIPLQTPAPTSIAAEPLALAEGPSPARLHKTPPPILLDREVVAPSPPPLARPTPPPEVAARPPLPILPEGAPWTGEILRQVREARGISVQQIAERTRVTRYHIENIEGERFSALPAPVYLRGILLSLARELRLDGQKVARSYLDRAAATAAPKGR